MTAQACALLPQGCKRIQSEGEIRRIFSGSGYDVCCIMNAAGVPAGL